MHEAAFHQAIAQGFHFTPDTRFGIYRNNVNSALINALRVRYPVTEKLVGPRKFTAATQEFVAAHKPHSPVLIDYGDDYPDFIAANSPLPYLADVARFESLWWRAYHAADAEPLAAERFASLTPKNLEWARFTFHSSAAILTSPWAIGAIWEAARRNTGLDEVQIARPQSILVWRPHGDVRVHVIDDAAAAFLGALMKGKGLVDAISIDPQFDPQAQLQMLIALQLIIAIRMEVQR